MAPMIESGQAAPAFTLTAHTGEAVSLEALRGKTVVLYFYPKDDTPGCTKEACSFRDHWATLQAQGVVVLGVSPDGVASHEKFATKYALPFPLLADPDHAVAEAYGTWGSKSMYGKTVTGILRTTFLIGADGIVRHVFKKPKTDIHAEEVLARLAP
ncbi:MAG: thioredoxin-dependent thiol peroxidase [Candidatus Sericytochromatia bacterium]|nr:thioredoxin-dependent thiol peroxidase [Candidatus Sericytochromatia bacterium]MEB3221417.1 thioredoxin-dependent thiol peroxidase [Candidatus Sericytochromatia bacterium]